MHFFNQVPVMALVELIRGLQTAEATVDRVAAFAKALGKTPIVVRNSPGFVVNRLLASLRAFFMALSMSVSVAAMLGNSLPLAATFGQLPSFLLGSSDLTQSYADMKKALSD